MNINRFSLFIVPSLLCGHADIMHARAEKGEQKKNVLFLIVDDMRTELNCYGAKYMKTPNMDALASQGVMFENAYCNVPVSGASRASLFSGLRPGQTRFWDVNAEIDREAPGTVTLPQYFKENGYVTISNSKVIHGKNDAKERSWSEVWMPEGKSETWRDYLGNENLTVEKQRGGPEPFECLDVEDNAYFDGKTADKTIEDLRRLKESGQPFFLAAGILKPHLPFNAPKNQIAVLIHIFQRTQEIVGGNRFVSPRLLTSIGMDSQIWLSMLTMRYVIIRIFLPRVIFRKRKL